MKKTLHLLACLALVVGVWACEQPKAPDFKLNHEIEAPLTIEKTYPFLGKSEALIDTTSEDYVDLFSPDANGLVRITKEQDFDFGDLNDAIPEVDADPASVDADVGEISLTNFNSGSGNVGTAGFTDITGSQVVLSKGDPVPAGSTPGTVEINFSTDYFQSAVIKENGALQLTITNQLGFNIDVLNLTLQSGSNDVGSTTVGTDGDSNDNFAHNTTETVLLDVPANVSATNPLEDISVDITANWNSQTMKDDGGNLIVNDVIGQGLVASQVTAAVESQSFNDSGSSTVDQSNFEFRNPDSYVKLSNGDLDVNINSELSIAVNSLDIAFPDIVDDNGQPLKLPTINVSATGNYSNTIDLSGYRIKAQNGTVRYTIDAKTENTQNGSGSGMRTISETDGLIAEVDLNNLQISEAKGYVVPRVVMLNTDQTNDGRENVDVFNNDEAELTNIDGMSDLSDRVSDLTFENPTLRTLYNTNLGVNTTIYAIIAGTDAKGNTTYLTGKSGSKHEVTSSEVPSQLEVNGQPADASKLIKFAIDTAESPSAQQGEEGDNVFNTDLTTISKFFSNLPTKIRFVGVAKVNKEERSGMIVNPVIFDPKLSLDLPLNFSADGATFKDTLDADLSDLPDGSSKQNITGATLKLNYTNALPLNLDLVITMLDENGQEVTHKGDITVDGASVGNNGYVSDPAQSNVQISFDEDELKDLHRTRRMMLDVTINTPEKQAVSIKADDSVTLRIRMKADITSTVN